MNLDTTLLLLVPGTLEGGTEVSPEKESRQHFTNKAVFVRTLSFLFTLVTCPVCRRLPWPPGCTLERLN